MILAKEILDRIGALRNDNSSGAGALAEVAGEILTRVVDLGRSVPSLELRSRILAAGKAIIKAQPAMAPVYTIVNDVLGTLAESGNDADLAGRIRERAHRFSAALRAASEAAALNAASLIAEGSTVVTHSRSSVVEGALRRAAQEGKTFSVVCTESRPTGEGRELAESLSSAGISTTLVIDAAVPSFVTKDTVVMVGADALSVHGLVNKIGTRVLALTAHTVHTPMYVATTTHRFLPSTVPLSYQAIKDPKEISGSARVPYSTVNLYFDCTPINEITTCVTERSLLDLPGLLDVLSAWRIRQSLDLEACG
jgi:translation initiation factor 2B subunit (eIF-2B alpha/beta/delta family)